MYEEHYINVCLKQFDQSNCSKQTYGQKYYITGPVRRSSKLGGMSKRLAHICGADLRRRSAAHICGAYLRRRSAAHICGADLRRISASLICGADLRRRSAAPICAADRRRRIRNFLKFSLKIKDASLKIKKCPFKRGVRLIEDFTKANNNICNNCYHLKSEH